MDDEGFLTDPSQWSEELAGDLDIRELYRLYPTKPAKKMAWLAGLRKPVGCV